MPVVAEEQQATRPRRLPPLALVVGIAILISLVPSVVCFWRPATLSWRGTPFSLEGAFATGDA